MAEAFFVLHYRFTRMVLVRLEMERCREATVERQVFILISFIQMIHVFLVSSPTVSKSNCENSYFGRSHAVFIAGKDAKQLWFPSKVTAYIVCHVELATFSAAGSPRQEPIFLD
jgi:hypothetical protein